uniref:Uncharacterized protein n=1 Tax=Ciona intestinalis TaxID=7719 RepID=H2XN20_CIOIN
ANKLGSRFREHTDFKVSVETPCFVNASASIHFVEIHLTEISFSQISSLKLPMSTRRRFSTTDLVDRSASHSDMLSVRTSICIFKTPSSD